MTTKEFEKQTLDQLLIDLKDIDNYKSFRKGAFVYDLGHYQGQLLLNEINRLNNIINKAIEYINNKTTDEITGEDLGYSDNIEYEYLLDILKGDNK
jgi:hypothetical protein